MNTKFIVTAVFAVAAMSGASAYAQNNLYGEAALVIPPVASTSNVTRAQVQAEYLQARQKGELPVSPEGAFAAAPSTATSVTRVEVRAQAIVAARAAQITGNSTL